MKCKCCGEEIGNLTVCPICGAVVENSKPKISKGDDLSGNDKIANENILQQLEQQKIDLIENCSKSVSKIIKDTKEYTYSGTGWCGYKDIIITNSHVIEDEGYNTGKIYCEFSDKLNLGSRQRKQVKVIYHSSEEDIALLAPIGGSIPSEVPILNMSNTDCKQGELVFTIGNPLHYKFTYTEGAVANPNYQKEVNGKKFDYLQTTLTLNHGNSGGPVFNSKGEVVGMATFSELKEEVKDVLSIEKLLKGEDAYEKQSNYTEILGYGFCVKTENILKAIEKSKCQKK